eukprot:g13351.t1
MSGVAPEFDQVWRYGGWTTTADEIANDGAVDSDGSVILVGSQGRVFEQDELDDTFVDETSGDFAAVKLSSSGEVMWTWTKSSSDDEADSFLAVDTDSENNIIMGGFTEGFFEQSNNNEYGRHMAVVKLSSSGAELWRHQEGPSSSTTTSGGEIKFVSASVSGVAVDGDDNVILVGQTIGSLVPGEGEPGDSDAYVLKLDGTDGSEIWTTQDGSSFGFGGVHAAKVDAAGDVIAVGIDGGEDAINFVARKLSGLDGTVLWEYSPETSFTHDVPNSVDVDAQDDVYVCGGYDAQNLQGAIAENPVVLKLSGATGDVIWTYEGASTSRAIFMGVSVDPLTGWIVAAGGTEGTWVTGAAAGGFDFAAVLLNGDGEELSRYQDGTTEDEILLFAEFDSSGGLFLGGTRVDGGQTDVVAINFAPFGVAESTPATSGGLAEWEIGAIAGAVGLFLLLLGLCLFCFRKRPRDKQDPPKGASGSLPVETFGDLAVVHSEPPPAQSPPPVKAQMMAAPVTPVPVRSPPPPACVTPAPMRSPPPPAYVTPAPLRPPPPAYRTPARPELGGELSPPPAYIEMTPPEPTPAAPQAETAVQRLANRVARVPSKKAFDQNYRDMPVRQYGPYAPAPPKR